MREVTLEDLLSDSCLIICSALKCTATLFSYWIKMYTAIELFLSTLHIFLFHCAIKRLGIFIHWVKFPFIMIDIMLIFVKWAPLYVSRYMYFSFNSYSNADDKWKTRAKSYSTLTSKFHFTYLLLTIIWLYHNILIFWDNWEIVKIHWELFKNIHIQNHWAKFQPSLAQSILR